MWNTPQCLAEESLKLSTVSAASLSVGVGVVGECGWVGECRWVWVSLCVWCVSEVCGWVLAGNMCACVLGVFLSQSS